MHSWSLAFIDFITWIAHIAMFKNALSQTFIKGGRLLVFHGYRNTWWMNLIPCECVCVYHRLCCFLHNVEHLFSTASESSVNQTTRSKGLTPCESGFGVVFLRYGILTIVSILSLILAWRIKMHVHSSVSYVPCSGALHLFIRRYLNYERYKTALNKKWGCLGKAHHPHITFVGPLFMFFLK